MITLKDTAGSTCPGPGQVQLQRQTEEETWFGNKNRKKINQIIKDNLCLLFSLLVIYLMTEAIPDQVAINDDILQRLR